MRIDVSAILCAGLLLRRFYVQKNLEKNRYMGYKALCSQVVSHNQRLCKIKCEQPSSSADAAVNGSQSRLATIITSA